MKFSVDRIEGNIVVLENLESKEMIDVDISKFDFDVKDGCIVILENGIYKHDNITENAKKNCLRERLNKLKKN